MDSNDRGSHEPKITLAHLKAALAAERDQSKNELIADLHGRNSRCGAFNRDRWMCKFGRHVAIENGLKLIRDLETTGDRFDRDQGLGGAV
jgi:hypothetical protein